MEESKYNLELEKALDNLTPKELLKYALATRIELMEQSYEKRLGEKTRKIMIQRDLDLTNPIEKQTSEDLLKR